jgi:hypothetical protein
MMKRPKVENSVGMKTKTSTNKTIKSLRKTRKKVLIKRIKMMNLAPLRTASAGARTREVEGKI